MLNVFLTVSCLLLLLLGVVAVLLWEMVVRDLPYRHYNDNMMDIAQAVVVRASTWVLFLLLLFCCNCSLFFRLIVFCYQLPSAVS